MRKFALILCLLGFALLIVGIVLASPSVQTAIHHAITISSSGTIVHREPSSGLVPSPEGTNSTQLSQIGCLTILLGIGFFSVGLLINRKRN